MFGMHRKLSNYFCIILREYFSTSIMKKSLLMMVFSLEDRISVESEFSGGAFLLATRELQTTILNILCDWISVSGIKESPNVGVSLKRVNIS